jgi:hypothetical protein
MLKQQLSPKAGIRVSVLLAAAFIGGTLLAPSTPAQNCTNLQTPCTFNVEHWSCSWLDCTTCVGRCCYREWGHGTGSGQGCSVQEEYTAQICGGRCGMWDWE